MGVEYSMCKYCENADNELEVYSDLRLRASIETRRGNPYIEIWGSLDGGYFGYADIDGEIEINYCPVCGRKLAEEADSEFGEIRNE